MKTRRDILDRLELELKQWFVKQCRNPYDDYYLYHLPASPSTDGGVLICKDKPENPDYVLSWPERIRKDLTVEQNLR